MSATTIAIRADGDSIAWSQPGIEEVEQPAEQLIVVVLELASGRPRRGACLGALTMRRSGRD